MTKRMINLLLACGFCTCLFAVPVLVGLCPDASYSITENRALQQRPEADKQTFHTLISQIETYVTDQFPFREWLLKAYSSLEISSGKRMVRGNHVVDSEWLLPREYARADWQLDRCIGELLETAEAFPKISFYYAMVPFKTGALYRLDPDFVDNRYAENNRRDVLALLGHTDNLHTIDIVTAFEQNYCIDELKTMYFKTDYHWNAVGAQRAAEQIQERLIHDGVLPAEGRVQEKQLTLVDLTGRYQGDLGRQLSGQLHEKPEPVPAYRLRDTESVNYFHTPGISIPATREELIGTKSNAEILTYNGIYTENIGYYRVENLQSATNKRILILKDSFQNPTTDFFSALFHQTTVIDPRYYQEPYNFQQLLEIEQPDLVLYFYHQSNFSNELVRFLEKPPFSHTQ